MKFFEEIILNFQDKDTFTFETKDGDKITDEYLQSHYFEETGFIENTGKLKYTWQHLIKTKYEKNIIGHGEKYGVDYFFLTKYFPTNKYPKLNQDFVFDFKKGRNTEYYAKIFSESILNLLNQDEELAKTITILPIPASTKLGTEKRYKKLFELISENTGVINGYDIIKVTKDREASHLIGKDQDVEENYEIDFDKISYPYRIIIIDDLITKGRSFSNITTDIMSCLRVDSNFEDKLNNSLKENFIIGLFLAKTYKFDYKKELEIYSDEKEKLKEYLVKGEEFIRLEKFNIKEDISWINDDKHSDDYFKRIEIKESSYRKKSIRVLWLWELVNNYLQNHYIPLIELGNTNLQYKLGSLYEKGIFIKKDNYKAEILYKKPANRNSPEAMTHLGFLYEKGLGVKQNYTKAKELYEESAKKGNNEGIYRLGYLYEKGLGIEQNYTKAKELYEESAKKGNNEAIYGLGHLYEKGLGVEQNCSKAIKLYKEASNSGVSEAQYRLGHLYEKELEVKQDYSKAIELYEESAKKGNNEAQYKLGKLYEEGKMIPQDYSKAFKLYEESAKKGNTKAQYRLGYLYEKGLGVRQNYTTAFMLYNQLAEQNNTEVLCSLGYLYEKGLGVEQDWLKAIKLYKKLANQGNLEAIYRLAYLYENGVKKNYTKAKIWYKELAKQNNLEAIYRLGYFYEKGLGGEKDYTKAKEYYEKAANQGNIEAKIKLASLCGEKWR